MYVLVLNSGSSSLKYQLFDFAGLQPEVIARGLVENIGQTRATITHTAKYRKSLQPKITNHQEALQAVAKLLCNGDDAVISDPLAIKLIGHRVVHGGDQFSQPTLITDEVLAVIKECSYLAPLHNPANIDGIEVARQLFPQAQQVAVFDTAFHQTIPDYAYLYAIPYELYSRDKIRRYGFHGTSHLFVAKEAAEHLGRPLEELNLITLHIGNGASGCCIKEGKSIDTSMGLTPLEGLIMGSRSGDLDPALLEFISQIRGISLAEVVTLLNRESGLKGICGENDLRIIWERVDQGDELATKAVQMYCYRIRKYIGSYMAVLGRVDGIIFTAGVGENDFRTRELVLSGLEGVNIYCHKEKNRQNRVLFSTQGVPLLRIETNEELEIALQAISLV